MNEFKKKMKEKIKLYSKDSYLKGYIRDEYKIDDKDADIYLYLSSKDQLFDVKTGDNQIDLCNDIYEFIEAKSEMLENDTHFELHINGIDLTNKEQGMVKHIIKEHYAIELYKIQKKYKEIRNKILGLFIYGIVAAIFYFYFLKNFNSNFISEILSFSFSFALWEAFDAIIYSFSEVKYERENVCQNLLMDISFNSHKSKKEDK